MRTIAVVNQKGGCGKTITSINLSAFLALAGRRVLLVDMDPQAHATLGLSAGGVGAIRTMYDVFLTESRRPRTTIADITRPAGENLDLAPGDIRLSAMPEALAGIAGREDILTRAFGDLPGRYDYVVVDCPPNVGLLTFNALKACAEALIPMDPSFFSLHGMGKLFETFELLERETGHRISPRVLVTLYSGRTNFMKAVLEEVHSHLAGQHYATVVRQSVKLAEAASHGVPICGYAQRSVGFEDYQALAAEILEQEGAEPKAGDVRIARAPALTAEGVVFTIEAPAAERVELAGDFNDWTPEGCEKEVTGRLWTKLVRLAPGRYRYRYIIDGEWHSDPYSPEVQPSPFGGDDSVLELHEADIVPKLVLHGKGDGAA
jgi:chromosome partitioning protein